MQKAIAILLLCLMPGFCFGQVSIGGNVQIQAVGASGNDAVIAVMDHGAHADGSTDDSTAIAAAFAVANAVTIGSPAVYFGCSTGGTKCEYKYGGSGVSPINPLRNMAIFCAPGVTLNYTGTAHAADIGPTGLSAPDELPYEVHGCRFTGGVSSTAGIYINPFITNTILTGNTFYDFGNRTGFNIQYAGNNWESLVEGNSWFDDDGLTRNLMDAHAPSVNALRLTNNDVECINPPYTACAISPIGIGFWVGSNARLYGNVIQYHQPWVRFASSSSPIVINNHFESNGGVTSPGITFGNPGEASSTVSCLAIRDNVFYFPASGGTSFIGPEPASSDRHYFSGCHIDGNYFGGSIPTQYVDTYGTKNFWGVNAGNSGVITQASSAKPFTFPVAHYYSSSSIAYYSGTLSGISAFLPDQQNLGLAGFHQMAMPLQCANTVVSGTAQTCLTVPVSDWVGNNYVPAAGDCINYSTNTANTGALTLAVDYSAAKPVKKRQGTMDLVAGDIRVGSNTPMCFDGIAWELPDPVTP